MQATISVGFLVCATGKYIQFVRPLIDSAKKHVTGFQPYFFVFTDSSETGDYVRIPIVHEKWPLSTLKRYYHYLDHIDSYDDCEYLFAIDADMLFQGAVGPEILDDIVAVQHPGFFNKPIAAFTYERNEKSMACIPKDKGHRYYAGGLYGGKRENFIEMVATLVAMTETDLNRGIIPIWHDESHLNRYLFDCPPTKVLTPSYCYPEGKTLPFDAKVVALNKNHGEMRKTPPQNKARLSTLVFSKDRPLFLRTHLQTMLPTMEDPMVDATVLYTTSSQELEQTYLALQKEFPWAKFVREKRREDIVPFMREWLKTSGEYVMVTVDDNVYGSKLDTDAIRVQLKFPKVFGFTLRLGPGICHTQDGHGNDVGPKSKENVVVYDPSRYGLPWNYVWEMSSTFFRKESFVAVFDSGHAINSINDLESAGLQVFPPNRVSLMACFNKAPVTNIFVESWMSPQCVSSFVSNDTAFKLFKKGVEIDIEETFRERDRAAITHVKKLFLKPGQLANSAVVVVPGRNCEQWVGKCIDSLLAQTWKDIGIIFIDDCSDDKTFSTALEKLAGKRDAVVMNNGERRYAMENIYVAITKMCTNPESVIFLVDGDDWLEGPTAIEEMMEQHKTADVVWSKYRNTDNYACCCGPLGDDIRNGPWVASHLRSFKKFLFDAVKREDFLDADGTMYRMTWDQAILLPILEQTPRSRIRFYDKVLYVYNRENPANDDKVNRAEQVRMERRIRAQRPYLIHRRFMEKSISVVVSSFNQLATLKLTLDSMLFQVFQPKEVIIADDGSTDGTIEWLESISRDQFTFAVAYTTRKHEGYRLAAVNTEAARRATGSRVLFTNADVIHCPDSLQKHMELGDKTVGAGIIKCIAQSGIPEVTTGTIAQFASIKELITRCPSDRTNLKFRHHDPNWCLVAVWGGNFSISREMLTTIGYFDQGYIGWGGEDADVAKRCVQNGGNVVWVDDSLAVHLDHPVRTYSHRQLGCARYNGK